MGTNMIPTGGNGNGDSTPIAYKGVRVMTTDRLAKAFGTDDIRITQGYNRNKDKFTEGVHFFRVKGDELKQLKASYPEDIDPNSPSLMLWTERGAMNHTKVLETPEAWQVYGQLVDTYFAVKDGKVVPLAFPARVAPVFKDYFSICRLIGMDMNQAALGASRATKQLTGIDPLEMVGAPQLNAPQNEDDLSPTDIGAKMGGKSGMAVNSLLAHHGYQTGWRDAKGKGHWDATEKGKPFAVWKDTPKKHNDGTPVRQLRWSADIVKALQSDIDSAQAVG